MKMFLDEFKVLDMNELIAVNGGYGSSSGGSRGSSSSSDIAVHQEVVLRLIAVPEAVLVPVIMLRPLAMFPVIMERYIAKMLKVRYRKVTALHTDG